MRSFQVKSLILSGIIASLAGFALPTDAAVGVINQTALDNLKRQVADQKIPDEVIIKVKPGVARNQVDALAKQFGGSVVGRIESRGLYLLKINTAQNSAISAISGLKANSAVSNAFQNITFSIPENTQIKLAARISQTVPDTSSPPDGSDPSDPPTPSDPRSPIDVSPPPTGNPIIQHATIQHATSDPLLGYEWHLAKIRELATSSPSATGAPIIAVIDTGVYAAHPDLTGKVLPGFDFIDWDDDPNDENGHGTHVAGIAAANTNNAKGVHGLCPACKILPVRVLDSYGSGSWFQVMAGIDYADETIDTLSAKVGAKGILSMSLGGWADPQSPEYVEMAALLADVAANNKVIAVAAGNDNDMPYVYCQTWPENCGGYLMPIPASAVKNLSSGLSVAASDPQDYRSYFSNTNPAYTNIAAPGRFIWSTVTDFWCTLDNDYYHYCPGYSPGYAPWQGTSMATPVVSGSAARVWIQNSAFTAAQVKAKIVNTATALSTEKGWPAGMRRVDLLSALGVVKVGFVGYVVNPEVGDWYGGAATGLSNPINQVTVTVRNATTSTVIATTKTNQSGFYQVAGLTAGTNYKIEFTKPGYFTQTKTPLVPVASVLTDVSPTFMPIQRTAVAPFTEILATLTWDAVISYTPECQLGLQDCTDPAFNKGAALDFYLERPDGNTVSWDYWGNQYGALTRDWDNDYMPGSAMYIKQLLGYGTYSLWVNRGYYGGRMTQVNAKVNIYQGSSLMNSFTVPAACGYAATDEWWYVADIDGTTGVVTPVDTCEDD